MLLVNLNFKFECSPFLLKDIKGVEQEVKKNFKIFQQF